MPRHLRPVIVAALTGGALFIAAGVGTAAAPSSPEPLVIAVEGPQSGGQASNGLDQLRGVQLAVRQVNAHGGVLGRPVQIVSGRRQRLGRRGRRPWRAGWSRRASGS